MEIYLEWSSHSLLVGTAIVLLRFFLNMSYPKSIWFIKTALKLPFYTLFSEILKWKSLKGSGAGVVDGPWWCHSGKSLGMTGVINLQWLGNHYKWDIIHDIPSIMTPIIIAISLIMNPIIIPIIIIPIPIINGSDYGWLDRINRADSLMGHWIMLRLSPHLPLSLGQSLVIYPYNSILIQWLSHSIQVLRHSIYIYTIINHEFGKKTP